MKIQKKKNLGRGGGGGVRSVGGRVVRGSQGGCEQRIEVFVKIPKKSCCFFFWGGGGRVGGVSNGGVRVDVNREVKFL